MPRRYDTKEIRNVVGALDCDGVAVREITRRLRAGECGLKCGSIGISERQVYNYRANYRAEHGPPTRHVEQDRTLESISSIKQRAVDLAAREIAALESKRPGTMKATQASALRAIYKALDDMERWEEAATKRSRGRSKPSASNGSRQAKGAESALERLAREQSGEVGSAHG